ncbi:hypothetical protein [Nocardioides bizhenqiangii]|uniref:hypothetical protein n=1 Tax=Nocardioides bizhenqiangii TaxID=3095076 RepID=UPI0038620A0C
MLRGVDIEFTDDAIEGIADKAMERATGARGLRSIIEEVLLHVMHDVPSLADWTMELDVDGRLMLRSSTPVRLRDSFRSARFAPLA